MTLTDTLQELTLAQNRLTAQTVLQERAKADRDALIWEAYQAGATQPMIAQAIGLTKHRVKQIIHAQRTIREGDQNR